MAVDPEVPVADAAIEEAILALLAARRRDAPICPNEVARALLPDSDEEWRALMGPVREVARRLVDQGRLEMTQKGEVVDPLTVGGAIRLRLPSAGAV